MGDQRRAYVEATWHRRNLHGPRRHDTIRLIHVLAPADMWEVHTTGPDTAITEHPNRTQALARIAGIVGDAWVVTRTTRRPAKATA